MSYEFTGQIVQVFQPLSGNGANGQWAKKEFLVRETDPQIKYPKTIKFGVFGQDKFSAMPLQVGNNVKVSFDINARESGKQKGMWFNDISAWKVELAQQPVQQGFQQPMQQPMQQPVQQQTPNFPPPQGNGKLPF